MTGFCGSVSACVKRNPRVPACPHVRLWRVCADCNVMSDGQQPPRRRGRTGNTYIEELTITAEDAVLCAAILKLAKDIPDGMGHVSAGRDKATRTYMDRVRRSISVLNAMFEANPEGAVKYYEDLVAHHQGLARSFVAKKLAGEAAEPARDGSASGGAARLGGDDYYAGSVGDVDDSPPVDTPRSRRRRRTAGDDFPDTVRRLSLWKLESFGGAQKLLEDSNISCDICKEAANDGAVVVYRDGSSAQE